MQLKSIISAAPPLLLWPAVVSSNPVNPQYTSPTENGFAMVFRGDNRSPAEIRSQGGFRPSQGTNYWELDTSFSLYRHMAIEAGDWPETDAINTAFVTTTPFPSAVRADMRWRYVVSATPNIFTPIQARSTQAGFALGGIHWAQVAGWYEQRDAQGNPSLDDIFTLNPDYRPDRYESFVSTYLPSRPTWRDFVRPRWTRLMQEPDIGPAVGFTGSFPLEFEQYPPFDSIPGPGPLEGSQIERPVSTSTSAANDVTLDDIAFVADFMNRYPGLCNLGEHERETIDLTMEVDGERARCESVRTRLRGSVSLSTSEESSLSLEDILLAASNGVQNPEECDLDSLEPEISELTMEVDGEVARAMSSLPQGSTSVYHAENQSIHDMIVRMRDATEPSSCGLVTKCLSPRQHSEKRGTDAAELGALCVNIRKLQKKNQGKREVCHHFKELEFYFKIFDGWYTGTTSKTRALLVGPSGNITFDIADKNVEGFSATIPVDVRPLGSDTLELDKAFTNITIQTQNFNDQFEIESIVFRGQCVETGFPVEVCKFASMEPKWLTENDGSNNHEPGWSPAVTYHIDRSDWQMRPRCVYIEELEFDFQVGNSIYSAGTYDSISLTIGNSKKIPLAQGPSAGTQISSKVNMREYFGTDELKVTELTAMTVVDRTGSSWFSNDEWEVGGITLKARCATSTAMIKMPKFQAVSEAVKHKTNKQDEIVWRDNFGPADWVNM